MSCNITAGIANGCNTNIGGVKNVYLANSATGTWYTYEMDKGTASLVETYNVNQASSILGFTQTLTIQLSKMADDKQQQIEKIAEANSMLVRVETNNGDLYEFGNERGAYLVSGTTTTGVAYGDANQSELVIQADSKQSMTPQEFVGTLIGTWVNHMSGCTNSGGNGGQLLPAGITNNTGNIELFPPSPGSSSRTKMTFETGYIYTLEAIITTEYNSNAFDSSGNSLARYASGEGFYGTPPVSATTTGEPTQPGVETTFKASMQFEISAPSQTGQYNVLSSYATIVCQTSTAVERRFSGPATAFITITRTAI